MKENLIGWESNHHYYKLETVDGEERLKIDCTLPVDERIRKEVFFRRISTIFHQEAKRLYALTDSQAIAELDAIHANDADMQRRRAALKSRQEAQSVRVVE